jgi:hypothetical protein
LCADREELVAHYAALSKEAELREKRAQWRIRRHQLDRRRENYLRGASDDWASATDDFIVEPAIKVTDEFFGGINTSSYWFGAAISVAV